MRVGMAEREGRFRAGWRKGELQWLKGKGRFGAGGRGKKSWNDTKERGGLGLVGGKESGNGRKGRGGMGLGGKGDGLGGERSEREFGREEGKLRGKVEWQKG